MKQIQFYHYKSNNTKYFIINQMRNYSQDQNDSNDYSESSNMQSSSNQRIRHRNTRQKLVSLNVRLFSSMGFNVTANSFRAQSQSEDQQSQEVEQQSESEGSYVDYGSSEEVESQPAMEVGIDQQQSHQQQQSYQHQQSQSPFHYYMSDVSQSISNSQSPFFLQPMREEEGMSRLQINKLPTMQWSNTHNIFNRGQKCPVCLQEFQMGNKLRVMECLHRYHIACLDEWLSLKANCPSCRNPPVRHNQNA